MNRCAKVENTGVPLTVAVGYHPGGSGNVYKLNYDLVKYEGNSYMQHLPRNSR